ncbi:MAG: ribonuclease [Gallionella sp.]|nr:ribonuclease [Gallionella sp.]
MLQALRCLCGMLLVLASLSDAQAFQWQNHSHAQSQNQGAPVTVSVADLPAQARAMLLAIKQGGPFAYDRDGVVFGNFERALPKQARGYYREYTVKTPGVRSRGARRIISGSGGEYYYTDEHYQTFKRIRE